MRIELRSQLEKSPSGNPADDFQPYIDTFLLDGASDALGGVLVLPGGGYHHRAKHEGNPVAEKFNALGYHAFVLQYRVAPYTYPAPQLDLVRAVKIIRSHAQEWKLGKLAVLGFSAGGHLAASGTMLANKIDASEGDKFDEFSGEADAMILCYSVISMSDDFGNPGCGEYLFGTGSTLEDYAKVDMHKLVTPETKPAFLWHSADDGCVNIRNSMEFAQAMWNCGNSCELHVFPHAPHGKGLAMGRKDISVWPELAAQFLETTAGFTRA
ncbi:MAG: alpha/beta hydrolase [Lentisphaeria bacterium]|nr:alpha/beta hydrolase [Lentisphaeria bacterium]